ncbi:MAG: extracellular solute-binding protein [Oscillospiraceae bacterium]|nr:extracellular solute-binding protein [Oscillospiraceae bacterium]
MNKFKRLLSCGLIATMLLGMTACDEGSAPSSGSGVNSGGQSGDAIGPGTSSTSTSATTDPDDNAADDSEAKDVSTGNYTPSGNAGTVKFLGYYDINADQKGEEQCKVFATETYGGTIEWISASSGAAYYEKLATLVASDGSPDLLTFEPLAFPYGVSKNMFEPLDEYIDIEDPLWDDMKPMIDEYEFEGKHYYVPHRVVTKYALNYNRQTVEDAGLEDPYNLYVAGNWTWDAWREMMIDFCNQADDNIGFYATSTMLEAFVNSTGTSLIDVAPDGTISNNIASADVTRSIEYLAELGRNGLLYPADHPHGDWVSPQVWAPVSDKILFLGMEPEWTYIAATEQIQNPTGVENDIFDTPSDFAFVPFPRDPDTDEYYMCSNTFGYMIPKGAKNIDGAVDFIYCNRLFETDQGVIDQLRNDHIAPAKLTYTAGKYEGMQKWQITWDAQVYDHWREMCDSSKFTFIIDDMYGFGDELSTPLTDAMYNSTFGEDSWTQLSEEISPVIQAIIDEYK